MSYSRRSLLRHLMFGASAVGLQSLATGIPISVLRNGFRGSEAFAQEAIF